MDFLNSILLNPSYQPLLAIIKGFRNGAVYGVKIRFPHALVMTFLFREGSLRSKVEAILEATFKHAWNLARFVFLYKSLVTLQKTFLTSDGKEQSSHSFLAGVVGGCLVFGDNNPINMQINLYLFSRISLGLAKLAVQRLNLEQTMDNLPVFPVFASVVWGIVMWLFRWHRDTLQGSLQSSMHYLYNDSNEWNSLRNWIWHNK